VLAYINMVVGYVVFPNGVWPVDARWGEILNDPLSCLVLAVHTGGRRKQRKSLERQVFESS
jgi:hypothetical protein